MFFVFPGTGCAALRRLYVGALIKVPQALLKNNIKKSLRFY